MIYDHYTLTIRIPLIRTPDGKYWAGELWHVDLVAHLDYVANFHICCPVEHMDEPPEKHLVAEGFSDANVIPMRRDRRIGSIIKNFIPNFMAMRKAVKQTEVIHSGGAGWAFPESYYLIPLRWVYRFKWMFLMESAFWYVEKGEKAPLKRRIIHHVHTFMLRWCARACDANVMTTQDYKDFLRAPDHNTHVDGVSWISEERVVPADELEAEWEGREGPIRIISVARLIPEKGIHTIINAVKHFDKDATDASDPPELQLDLIGSGPLEQDCRDLADSHKGRIKVRFLDPVPYGDPFFNLIRSYDGLLVANKTAEQVRVVFDAFSQGLPMISTATAGMSGVIDDDRTGYLFGIDDHEDLASVFGKMIGQRAKMREMGRAAREEALANTHQKMHRDREEFLVRVLDLKTSPST